MATVLVTGGAGFIGSHLVDALVANGHTVRVADNLSTGFERNLEKQASRIQFIHADLSDPGVAENACRDIEFVFHLAALPSVPRSVDDPIATQHSGENATLQLLNACAKLRVRRIIFAGSSSVYGGTEGIPKTETMLPRPLSPYAASKLACEGYFGAFAHYKSLDGIVLRYFNVFGPRQDCKSRYSAVITTFLNKMLRGEQPLIFGDGRQTRDFTYVENAVHANLLAMNAENPSRFAVCNIGCGRQISLIDLVTELNKALGLKIDPLFAPARSGDSRHSMADISRAKTLLGYTPAVHFPEGIKKLVESVKADA